LAYPTPPKLQNSRFEVVLWNQEINKSNFLVGYVFATASDVRKKWLNQKGLGVLP